MNTRTILGAVIGGLILWICQFMSWGLLDLHYSNMQYTDKQEIIMEALNAADIEEGDYFLPRAPKGDQAAMEAMQADMEGKPWAMVSYRSAYHNTMTMNLVRGLVMDIIVAWLFIWIFGKMDRPMMSTTVMTCIAVGLIGYLLISYNSTIWFQGDSIPDLIDAVVPMGLLGAFFGWWLNRD